MTSLSIEPGKAALKIETVSKSFGTLKAVDEVSLEIRQGEIFGLLGPNGAGKSTTINMTAGVTPIDSGQISIFGYNNRKNPTITRRLTGVMHQEIIPEQFLPIGKALELHSGLYGVKDDPVWRNLLITRLDLGPHLGKRMLRLSGGMKRRFMVAKALIHRPRFLILDEPTAGVDVELRRSLWEFVREINDHGTTVLLTTHYLEEAEEMCDRIAIMNHGKVIAMDQTKALVEKLEYQKIRVKVSKEIRELPAEFQNLNASLNSQERTITIPVARVEEKKSILKTLYSSNLDIQDFEIEKPDLENVFIKLTSENSGASP